MDLYDKLKKYFDETSKEQVLKDWEEIEIYDNVNSPTVEQFLSQIDVTQEMLDFTEWIDINGIRDGQHEWKYKADNYKKRFSTQEMFDEWQRILVMKN